MPTAHRPLEAQVTVVIPTHDHRCSMVLEALDSVLWQHYTLWRVIVIDNASTDDTADAIAALANPKIELVRHASNLGPSGGRNAGIARAQTPWIAFLDSDDIWEPDFLEIVMEEARLHPEVSLFSARSRTFHDGPDGKPIPMGITPETNGSETMAERLLKTGNYFATSTVVVRTDAIRALGGFDSTLPRSEDTDLWLRLSLHYPSVHLPEVLARIRLHDGATQISEDYLEKLHRRIYICSKALATVGEDEVGIRTLIRRRLRVTWRERARALTERGRWHEAAQARQRQWHLRRADPKPLLQWTYCRLRALSSSNGHSKA